MEHMVDPEQFVGMTGTVTPDPDDVFSHGFHGTCIAAEKGFLQVRDQDDEVFDIEVRQFSPDAKFLP